MSKFYLKKTIFFFASFFSLFTTSFEQEPNLTLTPVITGLTSPIQLVNAGDGSNRLFIVLKGSSQNSSVLVYDQSYNKLDTFLRITGINTAGEQGLLSMAFHPEYENIASPFFGFFFVYYTNNQGDLQIARYKVSGDANKVDTTSKDTVLTIPHPTNANHNGGTLHFGNDGYLYFATGDGGGGGDVPNNAQNASVLLGKMIRIDANSSDTDPFFSIPPTNPYVGVTTPDTLDAIFSFGLRNPFRWSFDKITQDIWIGDVGQGAWEEINYRAAGSTTEANYGWRCYEGNVAFNTSGCNASYISPVYVYPNPSPGSSAVTGGTVYRGTTVAANVPLQGYYLAADFYSGNIYKISPDGNGGWTTLIQTAVRTGIANFGETENGEVYAVSLTAGTVSSITTVSAAPLPVALVEFTANLRNEVVQLNWKTSSEQNLQQFEIEYGMDGNSFIRAGVIPATNAVTGSDYTFFHEPSSPRRIFYRLKMTDFDGQFKYSDIIMTNVNRTNKNFVQPSVVTSGTINIFLNNSFNTLELISMNGAVFLKQNINGRIGKIDIPIPFVTTGTYMVQLSNNETTLRQLILIRQ